MKSDGKMWGDQNPGLSPMEDSMEVPQKLNIEITCSPLFYFQIYTESI